MAEESNQRDRRGRDLESLVVNPRENLSHELKGWLDLSSKEGKANLAQAMLALANHGGGYIVLGIDDVTKGEAPARPPTLDAYTQDAVNGIVERYADPTFHCEVDLVRHPESSKEYPVVRVPGEHRAPIRAKRDGPDSKHVRKDSYYIRRPGPKSEQPQSAQEWHELMGRCLRAGREELLEGIRDILTGAVPEEPTGNQDQRRLEEWTERCRARWADGVREKLIDECATPYAKDFWHFAYVIIGNFKKPTVNEFRDILRTIEGHESGWPPWIASMETPELRPRLHGDVIECWLFNNVIPNMVCSDFWMASPDGMLFLLRNYQEDSGGKVGTEKVMDFVLPVWRVGECLLHAERMARKLGAKDANVLFQVDWHGLAGRKLTSIDRFMPGDDTCRQDRASSGPIRVPAGKIIDSLPEVVQKATSPLYTSFNFFEPPSSMYAEEIDKMRRRRR